MSFEGNLTSLLSHLFDDRFWWDTAPDKIDVGGGDFCIVQQVGGVDQWYVDGSLPEWQNARVQFGCWGKRRIDVTAKADLIRQALAASIEVDRFIVTPQGGRVNDYNDALNLYGSRVIFEIWYRSNQEPMPEPTGDNYSDGEGNQYVDELGNYYVGGEDG
jgi:hypothetical protein